MAFEDRAVVLLIKPAEKFLKAFVGADFLYGIELIAQLVVGPGFVDEVLTAVAGGHGFPAAFAARHDVMTARRHFPQTKTHVLSMPGSGSWKTLSMQFKLAARDRLLVGLHQKKE